MNQYPFGLKHFIGLLVVVFIAAFVLAWLLIPEPESVDDVIEQGQMSITTLAMALGGLMALAYRQFNPRLQLQRKIRKVMKVKWSKIKKNTR